MIAALSLLAGVLLGLGAPEPTAGWWPWAACPVAVGGAWLARGAWPVAALAALVLGQVLATQATRTWQELHVAAADTRLLLEGTVRGVPVREGAELRFDAEVRIVEGLAAPDARPRRARLRWRDAPVAPRAGERWRWLVRVSDASDTHNFAGLDTARVAFRDRIHLSARVLPAALTTRLSLANTSVHTLRARIASRIADHVADPEAAALLTALAVGVTGGMSTDQWRVFNATGTTHLVAISGMHVTLFATLMFLFARRLWRVLPAGRMPREPFALALGLVAAGAYSLLAGFSVPTQRTWLMLAIFAFARLAARHVSAGAVWSLALVGVLLFDALAPLDPGFWLSFIAVGVILAIAGLSLRTESGWRQVLGLQWAVMIALAPLTFAVFGSASLVGLVVNLVAIPVISLVLVPLVLLGAVTALAWPAACGAWFELAAFLHDALWPALVWAADRDFALWRFRPEPWWFAVAMPLGWLVSLRWPWALRLPALCLLLPLVFPPSRLPSSGEVRVLVLDAGRGVATLVLAHRYRVLYDTGDAWNTRGTRAARVVLPALDALGERRLDLVVLPRLDADRARGAALLAHERDTGEIVTGGVWPGATLPVRACRDERFTRDGVEFQFFAVGEGARDCVLRLEANGHSLLLAGDLDERGESALLARLPPGALASDVVLMSRGGSARASGRRWIEATAARLAVAAGGSVGSASRARALERWSAAGVEVLDVQRDGALDIHLGEHGFAVVARARMARFPFAWRRVP